TVHPSAPQLRKSLPPFPSRSPTSHPSALSLAGGIAKPRTCFGLMLWIVARRPNRVTGAGCPNPCSAFDDSVRSGVRPSRVVPGSAPVCGGAADGGAIRSAPIDRQLTSGPQASRLWPRTGQIHRVHVLVKETLVTGLVSPSPVGRPACRAPPAQSPSAEPAAAAASRRGHRPVTPRPL